MIDIIGYDAGFNDVTVADTDIYRATNILKTQLGSLNISKALRKFGVDIDFFIQDGLLFQNESFRSYLVQRLAQSQVNVSSVISTFNDFKDELLFTLTNSTAQSRVIV